MQDERSIAELQRQLHAFSQEDAAQSYRAVLPTILLAVALQAALLSAPPAWLLWPLALVFGFVLLRLFAFYHDVQHGALFRHSAPGRVLVNLFSIYFTYPPSIWRERHNDHHRRNSQLDTREVAGEFPMLTVATWQRLSRRDRFLYRLYRHPVSIACGYVPYFVLPVWQSFRADPRRWSALLPVAGFWAAVFFMAGTLGWHVATAALVLPVLLASALGSYLFYAQHCFRGARYRSDSEWSCHRAVAESTSFFLMPRWLHWLTGNIGYHHVHHLNARIPFYKLPAAMAALPGLQHPRTTDWRLGSVFYNLTRHVWDEELQTLLTYREAGERRAVAAAGRG